MDNSMKTIAKTADLALRSQQAFYAEVVNACQIDVAQAKAELDIAKAEIERLKADAKGKFDDIERVVDKFIRGEHDAPPERMIHGFDEIGQILRHRP